MGLTADEIVTIVVFCVLAVAFVIECCVVFLYYKLHNAFLALIYMLDIEANKYLPLQQVMGLNPGEMKKNTDIKDLHTKFWRIVQTYMTDHQKNH